METATTHRAKDAHHLNVFNRWIAAIGTIILAAVSLVVLVQAPEALPFAMVAGGLAIVARFGYGRMKASVHERTEASDATANVGLVIAAIALAPLVAFALLWTALLLIIGVAWVLHLFGLA